MTLRFLVSALLLPAVLVTVGATLARAGYETAPYQPVRAVGAVEVRDYPALTVVETPTHTTAGSSGFGRLFRFISGRNASGEKIAMTTPIFMGEQEGRATMAFVLPAALKSERVPRPEDESLSIREIPAGRFAVMRFSGGRSAKNEKAALERLQTWMAAEHLTSSSPSVYGYFDPPWVPPFLRHNEVMLRLDAGAP